jgi:hypothetical protein
MRSQYRKMTEEQKKKHNDKTSEVKKRKNRESGIILSQQYAIHPPEVDDEPFVAYDVSDLPDCKRCRP